MNALIIFTLLVLLMLTGMPVSIALGLTVMSFFFFLSDVPMASVGMKLFEGLNSFPIMAIPFFILAGNFLTNGGAAKRMIRFAATMVGHMYGGLGLAGVLACALFAAISGSSVATVVAIGSIILPAMVEAGYPKRFSAGVITTSGALGILFPPSINLVIFSIATNGMNATGPDGNPVPTASVGDLFIAGVIPGVVLAVLLGITTWYRARKYDYPRMPRETWGARWKAFLDAFWSLALVIIIIGGIYSGIFTPTEAAAIAAVYAFFISVFVYKDLKLRDVPHILRNAAAMSSMLLYIITNAVLFSFLLTSEQIPQAMASWMATQGFGVVVFLLLVNIILLAAGNFMDPSAIVLIMAPILYPVAVKLGVNPVHMGILMAVNMEVGMCHPPVGLNLYVASGITKMGISELTVAVWPWLLTMIGFLILVTYWPTLSLWLPHLLMHRRKSQKRLQSVASRGPQTALTVGFIRALCQRPRRRLERPRRDVSTGQASANRDIRFGGSRCHSINSQQKSPCCECGHAGDACQLTTWHSRSACARHNGRWSVVLGFLRGFNCKLAGFSPSCNDLDLTCWPWSLVSSILPRFPIPGQDSGWPLRSRENGVKCSRFRNSVPEASPSRPGGRSCPHPARTDFPALPSARSSWFPWWQ